MIYKPPSGVNRSFLTLGPKRSIASRPGLMDRIKAAQEPEPSKQLRD